MFAAVMLTLALAGQFPAAEFDALEREIVAVQAAREKLGGFENNAKRDAVDRKLASLNRVRERAYAAAASRQARCMQQGGLMGNQAGVANQFTPEQLAFQCSSATFGVVRLARRAEDLKEHIAQVRWGWSRRAEKEALDKELADVEAQLQ